MPNKHLCTKRVVLKTISGAIPWRNKGKDGFPKVSPFGEEPRNSFTPSVKELAAHKREPLCGPFYYCGSFFLAIMLNRKPGFIFPTFGFEMHQEIACGVVIS